MCTVGLFSTEGIKYESKVICNASLVKCNKMKIGVKFPLKSYRAVVGHVVEVFIKPPIIYHFFLKVPHFLKVHMCKYVAIFC
jgi:hypothetical protein